MKVSGLVVFLLTVPLTETLSSVSLSGKEPASPCPPRWRLFGQRCFAFYPVWSSWSTAESLCFQRGGNLVSLHTPEDMGFLRQIANTTIAVWLGAYKAAQSGSWFWSDEFPFRIRSWKNLNLGKTKNRACMEMTPKSEELRRAPCGELRFFICSTRASSRSIVVPSSRKPVDPGIVHGVSVFDVIWGYSDSLVEEILHSSSFVRQLWSGHLTDLCYASFIQQETLYLHRVSSTLEVLMSRLQETDSMRSLLLDTVQHYSNRNQSLLTSPVPQWLHFSLQTFHSVVLEEPVYWLVALSARASLHNILFDELLLNQNRPRQVSGSVVGTFYQTWRKESLKKVAWTQRYKKVIEEHRDKIDTFKAINIFRQHMMNQKLLHQAVTCDCENDIL
ncbi:uncharacterized protein [Channa argus]|uniref:uncharacterized protein isoform X2 n=1 Tax=Channa argus TaxID=215402 RepID=UPI002945501E|nr:hypothetical protein Q8A73_012788 [Channa argus]